MEPYRQQVVEIERKIHDLLDKPNDGAAQRLLAEIRAIESDFRSGKNPIAIEDRVKHVIHMLESECKTERIMNYEHLDMFKHQFEHLREVLRHMA